MLIAIVLILFAAVFMIDYLPAASSKSKGEKLLYLALFSISFSLLLLYSIGVGVPFPTESIKWLIDIFVKG